MSADDTTSESPNGVDETPGELVATWLESGDLARLAAKRGLDRSELLRQAIDALLAQEAMVGGFILPPKAMEIPVRTWDQPKTARRRNFLGWW